MERLQTTLLSENSDDETGLRLLQKILNVTTGLS